MSQVPHEDVKLIAAEAARAAVLEMLVTLGINARDPDAILDMQKDFAYVRVWRQSIDTVKTQSIKTAVGVLVTGLLGALYVAIHGWRLP